MNEFCDDSNGLLRTCPLSLQWRNWSANTGKMSRWKMGGMSKAFTDPFCLAPLRQRETRLDGSKGVRLLSAHSTPKKWWCKRCSTPMGNLIQTLLPAVILLLQGKIAKQVSPYPSILTLVIAGIKKLRTCCSVLQVNIVYVIWEFWFYALINIYRSQKSNLILRRAAFTHQILMEIYWNDQVLF